MSLHWHILRLDLQSRAQNLSNNIRINNMKKLAVTAILTGTLLLPSCRSMMPGANARTEAESATNGKVYIVLYDAAVGTDAIEAFIKKNRVEVVYRYNNINGYALRLQNDRQRAALKKTSGVLSVEEDQEVMLTTGADDFPQNRNH